jgi:RNA polymerase-binding transcription factor DksA
MIERGIHNARKINPRPKGFDGYCECGQEIPVERVAAGYYNCVPCQERIELRDTGKFRRR